MAATVKRGLAAVAATILLAACSASREARRVEPPSPPTTSETSAGDEAESTATTDRSTTTTSASPTSSSSTSTTATNEIAGVAVAGTAGGVEASGPPFPQTDPFSEAVRLSDGTCVGWLEGQAGSTAGLAVGATVVVLDAVADQEIGRGSIQSSRWEDMSAGGEQWNCLFDFTATLTTAPPPEIRIIVANLDPWSAEPDPSDPSTYVASVSTGASIARIASCPAVPAPPPTSTVVPTAPTTVTTASAQLVSGWSAVGQYWSRGVDALCAAGLPVVAVARPCRPPGVGSEYITAVTDADDPTAVYQNGASVPLGTELIVSIATGRLCA